MVESCWGSQPRAVHEPPLRLLCSMGCITVGAVREPPVLSGAEPRCACGSVIQAAAGPNKHKLQGGQGTPTLLNLMGRLGAAGRGAHQRGGQKGPQHPEVSLEVRRVDAQRRAKASPGLCAPALTQRDQTLVTQRRSGIAIAELIGDEVLEERHEVRLVRKASETGR